MPPHPLIALRRRLNLYFDEDVPSTLAARLFNVALALLIVVNVVSVILESVERINEEHAALFWWIEQVATVVFAIEYVLRVWTAVDRSAGLYRDPVQGRLRYVRSFFAIVDLVAVLPAILGMLGAEDLRVLRLLRLLRMLKLTRHSTAFALLWAVFREEAHSIGAVLFILLLTLTLSGSLMYMIEGEAQPTVFSSIPAAMWWAVETLTTVGYGDIVPVTAAGKLLGGVVSVVGVGALALFSGLITVSFMDQLRLRRREVQRLVEARLARGPLAPAETQAIERIGERLGLPEEIVEETIAEEIRPQTCPRCGHVWHTEAPPP